MTNIKASVPLILVKSLKKANIRIVNILCPSLTNSQKKDCELYRTYKYPKFCLNLIFSREFINGFLLLLKTSMSSNDSGTSNSKMRIGIAKARFPGEFIPVEHSIVISAWKYL